MSKIAAASKPGIDATKKVKWDCSSVFAISSTRGTSGGCCCGLSVRNPRIPTGFCPKAQGCEG